jgi:Domain of unknown function (DUF5710)
MLIPHCLACNRALARCCACVTVIACRYAADDETIEQMSEYFDRAPAAGGRKRGGSGDYGGQYQNQGGAGGYGSQDRDRYAAAAQSGSGGDRILYNVPFDSNQQAKQLGARFDSGSKKWCVAIAHQL